MGQIALQRLRDLRQREEEEALEESEVEKSQDGYESESESESEEIGETSSGSSDSSDLDSSPSPVRTTNRKRRRQKQEKRKAVKKKPKTGKESRSEKDSSKFEKGKEDGEGGKGEYGEDQARENIRKKAELFLRGIQHSPDDTYERYTRSLIDAPSIARNLQSGSVIIYGDNTVAGALPCQETNHSIGFLRKLIARSDLRQFTFPFLLREKLASVGLRIVTSSLHHRTSRHDMPLSLLDMTDEKSEGVEEVNGNGTDMKQGVGRRESEEEHQSYETKSRGVYADDVVQDNDSSDVFNGEHHLLTVCLQQWCNVDEQKWLVISLGWNDMLKAMLKQVLYPEKCEGEDNNNVEDIGESKGRDTESSTESGGKTNQSGNKGNGIPGFHQEKDMEKKTTGYGGIPFNCDFERFFHHVMGHYSADEHDDTHMVSPRCHISSFRFLKADRFTTEADHQAFRIEVATQLIAYDIIYLGCIARRFFGDTRIIFIAPPPLTHLSESERKQFGMDQTGVKVSERLPDALQKQVALASMYGIDLEFPIDRKNRIAKCTRLALDSMGINSFEHVDDSTDENPRLKARIDWNIGFTPRPEQFFFVVDPRNTTVDTTPIVPVRSTPDDAAVMTTGIIKSNGNNEVNGGKSCDKKNFVVAKVCKKRSRVNPRDAFWQRLTLCQSLVLCKDYRQCSHCYPFMSTSQHAHVARTLARLIEAQHNFRVMRRRYK
eukprot:g3428.t1